MRLSVVTSAVGQGTTINSTHCVSVRAEECTVIGGVASAAPGRVDNPLAGSATVSSFFYREGQAHYSSHRRVRWRVLHSSTIILPPFGYICFGGKTRCICSLVFSACLIHPQGHQRPCCCQLDSLKDQRTEQLAK